MKKVFKVILVVLLFCCHKGMAQKSEATLQFKDGKKLNGYGKLISKNRIAFRENLDEKAIKYNFEQCDYLEITLSGEKIRYVQLPVKGRQHKIIVKERILGSISLYAITSSGYAPTAGNFGTAAGTAIGVGTSYSINNYYVRKHKMDSLIHLGSNLLFSGRFNKKGADFFKDCPELAAKIQNKEKGFRKRNIEEIVKFYNANCY